MRTLYIALVISLLVAGSAGLVLLGKIDIEGVVNVPSRSEGLGMKGFNEVKLNITIDKPRGEVFYGNVASFEIGGAGAYVKLDTAGSVEGDAALVMGGKAILESDEGARYEVLMPCILSAGEACYRIEMLIPGYDQPMYLPPGNYTLSLEISWSHASGQGKVHLTISIQAEEAEAGVEVIGSRPGDARGWISAEGSTRSYAMLLETTTPRPRSDGYARTKAWIWVFTGSGEKRHEYADLKIIDYEGRTILEKNIELSHQDLYDQALVEIILKPGRYTLITLIGDRELTADIEVG